MANFTFNVNVDNQVLSRGNLIPTKIISAGLMSTTAEAADCFVNQQFSNVLQAYMINYVISVSGYYSVLV